MDFRVVTLPPAKIAFMNHVGPYDQIGPVFERLWSWINATSAPVQKSIGIYYDNPDEVPAAQLRSSAAVQVPLDYQLTNTNGLPVQLGNIAGGEYATGTYHGSYSGLSGAWAEMWAYVSNTLGRSISEEPAFEVYVNDPSDTPEDQLMTELYMPLA